MVDILGRKAKKEEARRDEEFKEGMALADAQKTPLPEDYVLSLGRSVYMIMDPEVTAMLNDEDNPQFKSFIPAFSHLNRTTNISEKEAKLLMLDYEMLDIIHTMNMNEDEYNNDGYAKLESLKIFARNIIADAHHGWKGRLVTEQIKIIRTELEKKKKGRLPF